MGENNKGNREMKSVSVRLTKCDDEIVTRNLRSRTTSTGVQQTEKAEVSSSKRGRQLFSVSEQNESEAPEKNASKTRKGTNQDGQTPAKRNRRLLSTPSEIGVNRKFHSPSSSGPNANQGDALSKAVGLNSQLTNELLSVKKQLFDKSEALLKMQQNFYEKDIECKNLLASNVAKDTEIAELKTLIDKIRADQFCNDLIDFGDGTELNGGESGFDDSGKMDSIENDDMLQAANEANTEALKDNDRDTPFAWTPTD